MFFTINQSNNRLFYNPENSSFAAAALNYLDGLDPLNKPGDIEELIAIVNNTTDEQEAALNQELDRREEQMNAARKSVEDVLVEDS